MDSLLSKGLFSTKQELFSLHTRGWEQIGHLDMDAFRNLWPMVIMYDHEGEYLEHGFKNRLIENEYGVK